MASELAAALAKVQAELKPVPKNATGQAGMGFFSTPLEVGLWNSTGTTLIATASVATTDPITGSYRYENVAVETLDPDQRSLLRRHAMGFIFQGFNLLALLSFLLTATAYTIVFFTALTGPLWIVAVIASWLGGFFMGSASVSDHHRERSGDIFGILAAIGSWVFLFIRKRAYWVAVFNIVDLSLLGLLILGIIIALVTFFQFANSL